MGERSAGHAGGRPAAPGGLHLPGRGGAPLLGGDPGRPGRVAWLSDVLPLPLLEASHFLASLVGVGLLLVSRGVWRRLDAAYYLAALGLVLGIVASLLKGGDYEEAALLGFVLLAFAPSRPEFDRRVAFFDGRLAPGWALAVLSVVGASVWLGLFSFKHVEYSHDLWWRFELEQDASRFLRASVGAMVALLVFGATRLLRPAPPEVKPPTDEELAEAERVDLRADRRPSRSSPSCATRRCSSTSRGPASSCTACGDERGSRSATRWARR